MSAISYSSELLGYTNLPRLGGAEELGRVMNKRSTNLSAHALTGKAQIPNADRLVRSIEHLLDQSLTANATGPTPQQLVKLAKYLREVRKSRGRFLDRSLFGEPAWDMLLALYISHVEQYRLKVTDLIHESRATSSTGLRWIVKLQAAGLIVRRENHADQRSFFLELPDDGAAKVTALLENAWRTQFPHR